MGDLIDITEHLKGRAARVAERRRRRDGRGRYAASGRSG